jgi:putative FmdB family regulatory protein
MTGVPIYEYECECCKHRFEIMQKFSDRPVKKCEKCGGPVHKVLSAPGLVFKGSGWYVTDYANSDRKKALKAEKESSGNGDKKTDATPAKSASKKSATSQKDV